MARARCRGSFACRLLALFVEYGNDHVFPLLWNFPLKPDEGGKPMKLQQDGPVLLKSEFQQFRGKAIRPHRFRVCHYLYRCGNLLLVGSILRALATGCCGSLFGMSGSSMSTLAFSSERKNEMPPFGPCTALVKGKTTFDSGGSKERLSTRRDSEPIR